MNEQPEDLMPVTNGSENVNLINSLERFRTCADMLQQVYLLSETVLNKMERNNDPRLTPVVDSQSPNVNIVELFNSIEGKLRNLTYGISENLTKISKMIEN